MKIKRPCFGIVVELRSTIADAEGDVPMAGTITSDLKEGCACREKAAMDAIESLILAHACAGVDIESPAYVEGIETAVEACWNNLL